MKTNLNSSANELTKTLKPISTAGVELRLLKTIGMATIIAALGVFVICLSYPWYYGAGIIAIAPIVIMLDIILPVRTSHARPAAAKHPEAETPYPEADEVLTATIPAVVRFGVTRSHGIMGTGMVLTPENALIVTNKAIWALTVPLQGADNVVGEGCSGSWQWTSAYEDIKTRLNHMISSLPFEEVLKQGRAQKLMKLSELQSVKALPYTYAILFVRADGKKFGYSIRLQKDFERAKALFGINKS